MYDAKCKLVNHMGSTAEPTFTEHLNPMTLARSWRAPAKPAIIASEIDLSDADKLMVCNSNDMKHVQGSTWFR